MIWTNTYWHRHGCVMPIISICAGNHSHPWNVDADLHNSWVRDLSDFDQGQIVMARASPKQQHLVGSCYAVVSTCSRW